MNISDNIRFIGADDTTLDLFEGKYKVPQGVTYNSYLILDEKTAVIDTIDIRKTDEWLENLDRELDGRKPDYLVLHHVEPDHGASMGAFLRKYPGTTVVASAKALQFQGQFFDGTTLDNTLVVKEGDKLSLGAHELNFVAAPMVHWPEVMVSYESSEKVLFSADGFGRFGASSTFGRGNGTAPSGNPGEAVDSAIEAWDDEARRYFLNIVGKYGTQVQALLKKAAGLDIRTIAPLHGPVLTGDLSHYISLYDTWSSYRPETEGVFIAFASIYGNTGRAARELADVLEARGVKVAICDLARDDRAQALSDAFRYSRAVLAASTYDADIFTPMADFLGDLSHKGFRSRRVGLIENGTWAPISGKKMREALSQMKDISVCDTVVTLHSAYKSGDRAALETLADELLR